MTGSTIVAVASAPGSAVRGVLRVSGPRAGELLRATCRAPADPARADGSAPDAPLEVPGRGAYAARFHDGTGEQPALVLWMPGPRSYTREDVLELHLPGNRHLVAAALARLLALGAEAAAPGEFTRRAFENGGLDLARAEGVLALVEASGEAQRRAATALLMGGLSGRVEALRGQLEDLRALCEASLDFDENDTGGVPAEEIEALLAGARAALAEARRWEAAREGPEGVPRVLLSGAPNAGKSALFNRLVAGDPEALPALVDDLAGSTRDAARGRWDLPTGRPGERVPAERVPVELLDSAGLDAELLRDLSPGAVDREAQDRSRGARQHADLCLWVVDAARGGPDWDGPPGPLLVWNQVDRPEAPPEPPAALRRRARGWVAVSALEGTGLDLLAERAARALGLLASGPSGATTGDAHGGGGGAARELTARHLAALAEAHDALEEATADLAAGVPLDLFAAALGRATDALDRITGRTTPDDLLDRIFSRFCIGK